LSDHAKPVRPRDALQKCRGSATQPIKTPAVAELFRTNGFAVPVGSTPNWNIQIEIIPEEPLMKTFLLLVVAASLTLSKTRWRATGTNPKSRLVAAIAFAGALGTSDRSNTTQTQSKTEGQGCDIRGRASGMLRARGTRPIPDRFFTL
jgi:hypothetical protein